MISEDKILTPFTDETEPEVSPETEGDEEETEDIE